MAKPVRKLDDAQRFAWLRLIRTPRVGPATFRDLVNHFGGAQQALDGLPGMAARRGKPIVAPDSAAIEAEMEAVHRLGARFVASGEPGYPALLMQSDTPPPLLCALIEDVTVASKTAVAMVGARNASAGGLSLAKTMARELGEAGLVVVSGLARGIDAAAHLGALDTGTLAFTAGGLARPYPPEHRDLMRAMAQKGGAVYSEVALDWNARAQDFPRRNRLVAGSSLGLVVVEAAKRSGSLITARQATELGRTVMAVPGFPLDPRSEGPNSLLRNGATLVCDAQDVLEELKPSIGDGNLGDGDLFAGPHFAESDAHQLPLVMDEHTIVFDDADQAEGGQHDVAPPKDAHTALSGVMAFSPIEADALIATTGLPAGTVRAWLLEHEMSGQITRYQGDRFAWTPKN